jgi:uncharacterized iron-regulated membrane protein
MLTNFRQTMAWLHTWFGLVLGFILMVCFFFGTLSVFDREIDRWAIPQTRFEPQPMPSFDKVLLPVLQQILPEQDDYDAKVQKLHDSSKGDVPARATLPQDRYWAYTTHRDPVLGMGVRFSVPTAYDAMEARRINGDVVLDPRSGEIISDSALRIGSGWFYPMHYSLNWPWKNIGYWIVGLAAFTMLVALVTGVILHRKVFREFFTFRPGRRTQRSALDLHNMTGVMALPFHFFFAFTGLVIFAGTIFLPVTHTLLKPIHDEQHVLEAQRTGLPSERSGTPAALSSIDAMVVEAKTRWAARGMPGEVGFLQVNFVGDENSYVSIYRAGSDRVALVGEGVYFQGSTGKVLYEDPVRSPVSATNEFLTGLHLQHFEHWLLRWLYVVGGLLGSLCIATGFIFFVEKRKNQHAKIGSYGSCIVDSLAVTMITGMCIAAVGMLVANRLLPAELIAKGDYEKASFWGLWMLAMVHAFIRSSPVAQAKHNPAWQEQCWVIAALAIAAVGLNWITTGDHLLKTLVWDRYWPVAGVDLSLITVACISAWAARKLSRKNLSDAASLESEKQGDQNVR